MSEMKKSLSTMERGVLSGAARGAAKAAQRSYEYFDLDGAKFRRGLDRPSRGVEDILFGTKWEPYTGKDRIKPTLFGDSIEDPLAKAEPGDQEAGAPEQRPMMRAIVDRMLFKAAPKK